MSRVATVEVDVTIELGQHTSHSNRKRHVLAIEGAQTAETRQRRLAKTLDELHLRA